MSAKKQPLQTGKAPKVPEFNKAEFTVSSGPNDPESAGEINLAELQLLKRNRELAILNAIAGALNRSLAVEEGLQETLRLVSELLGLRSGWVWLLDEHNNPYIAAAQDLPPYLADVQHPERMCGTCYCLDTFAMGTLQGAANINTITCTRLANTLDLPDAEQGTGGLRYHASIPLYAGSKPLGVFNVASKDWRSLEPDELQFLYTIGYQVGLAIERARLSDQATRTAARLATVEERNRLARELHDTLMQNLTGIAFYLETLEKDLPRSASPKPGKETGEISGGELFPSDRLREGLQRASELTRAGLKEARNSVTNLRAVAIQEGTLPAAVVALVEQCAHLTAAQPHFSSSPPAEFPRLAGRIEDGIYRIAQEALHNISQHAKPTEFWVNLSHHAASKEITLHIEDNGQGFDPRSIRVLGDAGLSGHYGLLGLRERARLLEAKLTLESVLGKGTRIDLKVKY